MKRLDVVQLTVIIAGIFSACLFTMQKCLPIFLHQKSRIPNRKMIASNTK
jgi:hypothetical protein